MSRGEKRRVSSSTPNSSHFFIFTIDIHMFILLKSNHAGNLQILRNAIRIVETDHAWALEEKWFRPTLRFVSSGRLCH